MQVLLTTVAFAAVVSAQPVSQCSPGNTQCCNSVQSASSSQVSSLLGLLGVVLPVEDKTKLVGLGC